MLRRCVRKISSARSLHRRPRPIEPQAPYYLFSRSEFSSTSRKDSFQKPAPAEETSGSGNSFSKLVLGSAFVGAAAIAAYQTGYIDLPAKNERSPNSSGNIDAVQISKVPEHVANQENNPSLDNLNALKPNAELKTNENDYHQESETTNGSSSEIERAENIVSSTENELSSFPESNTSALDEQIVLSEVSNEDNVDKNTSPRLEENSTLTSSVAGKPTSDSSILSSEETDTKEAILPQDSATEMSKDAPETETEAQKSLADSYSLDANENTSERREGTDALAPETETEAQKSLADSYSLDANENTSERREGTDALAAIFNDKEVFITKSEHPEDKTKYDDEKLLLGFIEAIHAAEKRQAETDAYIFAEEKRKLKENYEKALKDARARELMYAEEAAILEKELNKEKTKSAAAIKSLQEKAEQKLQEELRRKEEEADIQLKKAQELAKAELAAAIAREKSSQIEKIAEADLNINALCMAFYARSEEARQTHSVHKLALGTLALEDALSRGSPIRSEVDKLYKSLEGIDRDSLIELALSSLPEEALKSGTYTYTQLNQKFDALKGTLRHYSLIPAGGGGLLAHTVAQIASSIKVKEDPYGHGIESVISQVESLLVQGNFADAADALEGGVRGSEAEEVIVDWVRQARNRAVVQQTLSLLQSYAMSITFT